MSQSPADGSTGGTQHPHKGREVYLLAVLLLAVTCAAALILYGIDKHSFLFYGDAASHIVKARELVDSRYPGLESIGTVWLPLPHVLLMPFTAIDSLFFSGLAGAGVGIPCLIGTCILIFLIVRRLTGSSPAALLSACVFGLNPNVIYIALTPMSEAPLFFFVAFAGYAHLRWSADAEDRWLLLAALAVMFASLCRYEAWPLVPLVSLVAFVSGITFWKRGERRRASRMLVIAFVSAAGILFWLAWNQYQFGDVFQFMPWKYRPGPADARNPMWYRQESASLTLLRAVLNIFGPFVLLLCVAGLLRLRGVTKKRHSLVLLTLGLPALFVFVGVPLDFILIDQWWWNWRFVLVCGLFLSVVAGIGVAWSFDVVRSKIGRGIVSVALLAMPVVQLTLPAVGVATYEDAAKIFSGLSHYAAAFGEKLGSEYKGGTIVLFTGSGLGERIMVSSGLPLKDFKFIRVLGGEDILGPIRAGDRYVVIGKVRLPDSRQVVNYWLSRREIFLQYYTILSEDENYLLLEQKQ